LKSVLNNISTIIFDLGGVVLNLNPQLSIQSFSQLSGLSEEVIFQKFLEGKWAKEFERGEIDTVTFRNEVRRSLRLEVTDESIDESWNAMLLNLPISRLQMLSSLRDNYTTLILSNTNEIHIKAFNEIVAKTTEGDSINSYFDKVYYSHQLGMRKPDNEIYNKVLSLNNLNPEEALFIDDMESNIAGAKSVGLKTVHLTDQDYLEELFS
jgi:epoxide hydrolase-like predicted phosphatase